MTVTPLVLVRGGGDLGSGVAIRLVRVGIPVVITELSNPLCVRRKACFSEAVRKKQTTVEDVTARLCESTDEVSTALTKHILPVIVDESGEFASNLNPLVCVDARMRKVPPESKSADYPLIIGLGPGFTAGKNVHAVIETNRGPRLGRVYWDGITEGDTGVPEQVRDYRLERVIRAPKSGILKVIQDIGSRVSADELIAYIGDLPIHAKFSGFIRGMLPDGYRVVAGMKIGDLDPREDLTLCELVSDKSLAIGGGVLEAILTRPEIRKKLYGA